MLGDAQPLVQLCLCPSLALTALPAVLSCLLTVLSFLLCFPLFPPLSEYTLRCQTWLFSFLPAGEQLLGDEPGGGFRMLQVVRGPGS